MHSAEDRGRERQGDIVLTPGTYVYSQDESKGGAVKTFVGPTVITPTGQDRPVKFDAETRRYQPATFESAVVQSPFAKKGQYIILENPADSQGGQNTTEHPADGQNVNPAALSNGNTVNIPGPVTFALWPGQSAQVLDGHNIRSNEFLIVKIIDAAAAQSNWATGIVQRAEGESDEDTPTVTETPPDLSEGQFLIIPGTQVAFYIPPTGVQVVPDDDENYVRDAVTLETLEYCILYDENGNKRYERGAQVVFPKPTEEFMSVEGNRKFTAIELNKIQGLHIKVIAPYNDDGSEVTDPEEANHKEGDELFLTGDDQAIYFPRMEHSIIKYGSKKKHYATSIPHEGEGRYVMNRETGVIETACGPKMLLPNPINEVIVRRPLSDREVNLWYPGKDGTGNQEALHYNRTLRSASSNAGTEQYVSDSDYMSNLADEGGTEALASYAASSGGLESMTRGARPKRRSKAGSAHTPDTFDRGTTYTKPRTVTLDTKFESVPTVNVWTGYSVMVVSKSGGKRTPHVGPCTILLDYDQTLEVLSLSTGKPKTTDRLQETVYLRTLNNKVSDIIDVDTSDHIPVQIKLSMLVNFEGDSDKWFDVENYVKFLTDHVRSILKGVIRKETIEDFDADGVGIIRDALLGAKPEEGDRTGLSFSENGMVLRDVEVLDITIQDPQIRDLLKQAQHRTVASNIQLRQAEQELTATKRTEEIRQETASASAATQTHQSELERAELANVLATSLTRVANDLRVSEEQLGSKEAAEAVNDLTAEKQLGRQKREADQSKEIEAALQTLRTELLKAETDSTVARFAASQEGFSEALLALGNQETLQKVAESLSVQQMLGGKDFVEVVQKIFAGSPLEGAIAAIGDRAGFSGGGNSRSNLSRTTATSDQS